MQKWLLMAGLAMLLYGCAPWIGIHNVELGMTKAEVLQQMGKPNNVSGSGNEEYLWYTPVNRFWERYYIQIVDGKVAAYGRVGSQAEQPQ